ncbi:uncharacterized oxidoreductase MexAM1_META1p0182-like [Ostrinia nubilalis]|uniref:uncharacterized oxidoreductase MexAM1_META1p0182-like n=1 Tax=Ostrinia nubilalis TaxID=29057 RepID=UPI0030826B36
MSFNNKVALVTGASSGIGAAIALKFAGEGANVAIVGRNAAKLKDVTESISKVGNKPLVITADVTKESDAQRIINDTVKHFGKLDVLVNNAGVARYASITEAEAMATFDHIMSTNLRSAVYMTNLAAKHLIETKGNVINISSVAGQMVMEKGFAYCTSKAAMDHFARAIALDFAPHGVRVNNISPGPVRTDIVENLGVSAEIQAAMWEKFEAATPLKRVSDASEIAELAAFLASDKAVGITGSIYVTDNGILLSRSS